VSVVSPSLQWVPDGAAARAVELLGPTAAHRWCRSTAAALARCADEWGLTPLEPVLSGRGGVLWRAVSAGGAEVALKAPFTAAAQHFAAQQQMAALGLGPTVAHRDDAAGVAAFEWLPAAPLAAPVSADVVAVVADRLAALAALAPDAPPLTPGAPDDPAAPVSLVSWLRSRLEVDPIDVAPGSSRCSDAERAGALELLASLPDGAGFCHGDLNPANVLVSCRGDVWLVDARGVCGDVCYDLAVFVAKARRDVPLGDRLAAVSRTAAAAGFDVDRCRAWLCVAVAARV
jgi:hypothetical protein